MMKRNGRNWGRQKMLLHVVEPEYDWKLAVRYLANFIVFTTIFIGLYVLVHIWLHPSTIQGLEFGGLDLPVSIGEFVFYVVFVLQGERMLGIMSRFIKAGAQKVFTCNGKTRTTSIKFRNLILYGMDATDDPPFVMDVFVYDFDRPFHDTESMNSNIKME
ncbi:hypothetical protein ACSQ67_026119 [Phaseolus vulgaris]